MDGRRSKLQRAFDQIRQAPTPIIPSLVLISAREHSGPQTYKGGKGQRVITAAAEKATRHITEVDNAVRPFSTRMKIVASES